MWTALRPLLIRIAAESGVADSVVILNGAALNVRAGRTLQLTAAADGDPVPSVTWASDDEGVATVDANTGLVTAVAAGECTITATAGTATDTLTLTVLPAIVEVKRYGGVFHQRRR